MKTEVSTNKLDRAEREDRPKVASAVLEYRKKLHHALIRRMMELKFCTSPDIIECFKRRYLFDCHSVETSRALDLQGLKNAIELLETVDANYMLRSIKLHYKKFDGDRNLLRCTSGQVGKIQAVGIHFLGLKKEALCEYAKSTLKREVTLYDMTVEEAHQLIKRLEEWEAKVLLSKKTNAEVKK